MLSRDELAAAVSAATRIWLFLDYDGTLADFSPTPDVIEPRTDVIDVLKKVQGHPRIRPTVISGRRLKHVEKLVPIPGLLLAGTYGIELRTMEGERIERLSYEDIHPRLESLKEAWGKIIPDGEGFHLEDKGWAVAIHARFVSDAIADAVLMEARGIATDLADSDPFRILGGHKFLEVAPLDANKGKTVEYLLEHFPWSESLLIYIGDDDKDEEAFRVIKTQGGIPILVAGEHRESEAQYQLESPSAVLEWLELLLNQFQE